MIVKLLPDGQVQGRKQEEQHQEEQAHWNTACYYNTYVSISLSQKIIIKLNYLTFVRLEK